jgi:hypothetical protein
METPHSTHTSLAFTALGALLLASAGAFAAQRIVTAADVNGTWQSKTGEFKVWALGRQRLQVEFSGTYESQGTANTGEAHGIARIEGDTALFEPRGLGRCRITMKFVRAKLVVDQDGACGFGLNVTADGTYTKKNRRKPHFID